MLGTSCITQSPQPKSANLPLTHTLSLVQAQAQPWITLLGPQTLAQLAEEGLDHGQRRKAAPDTNTTRGRREWRPREEERHGRTGGHGPPGTRVHVGAPSGPGLESRAPGAPCASRFRPRRPVNCQHTPGTWLGSVVHDPDESLGQQVVVGGALGCTGHRELDALQLFRLHACDGERDKLSADPAWRQPCPPRAVPQRRPWPSSRWPPDPSAPCPPCPVEFSVTGTAATT